MAQLVTGYTFRPIQQPDTDRELFREIRELRKVTFAWQLAGEREDIAEQAKYRLACCVGSMGLGRGMDWSAVIVPRATVFPDRVATIYTGLDRRCNRTIVALEARI